VDLASGMPYACSLEELTPGRDVVDLAPRPGQVQDNCCLSTEGTLFSWYRQSAILVLDKWNVSKIMRHAHQSIKFNSKYKMLQD
jgi:hypothetical protein